MDPEDEIILKRKNRTLTPWLIKWSNGDHYTCDNYDCDEIMAAFAKRLIRAKQANNQAQLDLELKAIVDEIQKIVLINLAWYRGNIKEKRFQDKLTGIYFGFYEILINTIRNQIDFFNTGFDGYLQLKEEIFDYYYQILGGPLALAITPEANKVFKNISNHEKREKIDNKIQNLIIEVENKVTHGSFFSNKSIKKMNLII